MCVYKIPPAGLVRSTLFWHRTRRRLRILNSNLKLYREIVKVEKIEQTSLIYLVTCYVGFHLYCRPDPQMLGAGMPGTPSGSPVNTQALSGICVSARHR